MNIRTILCALPNTIGGYTILKDDWYTIVLNANLSRDMNIKSWNHEIDHINNGDYEKKSADRIEIYAHEIKKLK